MLCVELGFFGGNGLGCSDAGVAPLVMAAGAGTGATGGVVGDAGKTPGVCVTGVPGPN